MRPHTATRMGWNIWPALIFESVGAGAQRGFEAVVGELGVRENFAGLFENAAGHGRVAFLRDQLGGIVRRSSSTKKKSATVTTSRRVLMRSWISGAILQHLGRIGAQAGGAGERQHLFGQLFERHGADVLGVQPDGLGIERDPPR